jgi:hypothetical protein
MKDSSSNWRSFWGARQLIHQFFGGYRMISLKDAEKYYHYRQGWRIEHFVPMLRQSRALPEPSRG